MVRNLAWLIAAITIISIDAQAACRYGPEEVIFCDTPEEQAAHLQKQAERQKTEEAERQRAAIDRQNAYCAANPSSTDCRGDTTAASGGLQCPPGQVSTGGPATSAMCVDNVPIPTPRPDMENGPIGKASPGTEREPVTASSGSARVRPANQDAQVSSAADQKATRCKELAESAASTCESAMSAVRALAGEVSRNSGAMSQGGASGCGQMGTTANNAANQMQGHRNSCQSAVSQCNSTCDSALADLAHAPSSGASVRASQARARCQSAAASMSSMDLNINQTRTAANQANQCYQQVTGSPIPGMSGTAADTPVLAATPTPVLDCSNPAVASSNPVCVCRVNPAHSLCGSVTASADYVGAGAVKPELLTGTGGAHGAPVALGGPAESMDIPGYVPSRVGRMAQRPGGVGNVGGAGGAALPAPANFRGGGRPSRWDTNVLKGGSGGAGSARGGAAGGGYPEAGTAPGTGKNARAAAGSASKPGHQVDLRKFLPTGGRAPSSVGSSIGLRHTNIWTTVNGRYHRVSESLDP